MRLEVVLFRFRCLAQELVEDYTQVVEVVGELFQGVEYIRGLEAGTPPPVEVRECNSQVEALASLLL